MATLTELNSKYATTADVTGAVPGKILTTANMAAIVTYVLENGLAETIETLLDPWATQPIGGLVFFDDGAGGYSEPPKDKTYRYVDLTAGLTGAGGYNQGVLGTEVVSGSSPSITATAVVTLSSSPMAGRSIRLLNTERRFIRPGSAGTLEESQNIAHSHGVTDPGHYHTINATSQGNGTSTMEIGGSNDAGVGYSNTAYTGISIQSSGGNEARPRNVGFRLFRRIK